MLLLLKFLKLLHGNVILLGWRRQKRLRLNDLLHLLLLKNVHIE